MSRCRRIARLEGKHGGPLGWGDDALSHVEDDELQAIYARVRSVLSHGEVEGLDKLWLDYFGDDQRNTS
jgi:hypothetical protein